MHAAFWHFSFFLEVKTEDGKIFDFRDISGTIWFLGQVQEIRDCPASFRMVGSYAYVCHIFQLINMQNFTHSWESGAYQICGDIF